MAQELVMNLFNHHVFSSTDIDEIRHVLGKQFTPHELNITKKRARLNSSVCSCAVNRLGLSSFSYGEGAPIEAAVKEDQCSEVISLNFLTSGSGRLQQHGESSDISANQGLVINMDRPYKLDLQGYAGDALIFSHDALRQHARGLFGEKAGDINFQLAKNVDLAKPAGLALKNAMTYAMSEMNGPLGVLRNPISLVNLENYLLTQFITLHPNSFADIAESASNPVVMPRNLKRARDYIHAHAHEKITLEELATYAGCSYRSLQNIFGKVLGTSPMEYLRSVRLEGIRNELLNAGDKQRTVTEIANQWGFVHMGRLACMYRKQFGELPSDTLKQRNSYPHRSSGTSRLGRI
ncbi:hypothetical protein LH51_11340 [Nitrincola sp. A-D6]|uniref:helix-turn-helix domain-containing protein n=1 Tax=Nitrincola sp. A-D6 TaxID=1545442 RepID=UPI00051FBED7|nr:helix-turn-helix domain-containing protein [Nitrincola sp. A-D6]KGK41889.1 hypothetical protein LH51_11340 [Nitrincola sp. A-D6]